MRDRRYNADPELEGNLRSQKTFNRNISRAGATSSGQLLSNLGAGSAGRMRADATTRAKESNMNRQYEGEQAQMDYRLGDQRAGVNWQTDMANEQNRAAKDSMMGAGLSGVGQAGQMWSLMQSQKERDSGLTGIFKEGMPSLQFAPEFQKLLDNYLDKSIRNKGEN